MKIEILTSQQRKDASRKANFIERNAYLYRTDVLFKTMVDGTQYFTKVEQEASQRIIGGTLRKGDYGQNN
jgi:hypothetical protein